MGCRPRGRKEPDTVELTHRRYRDGDPTSRTVTEVRRKCLKGMPFFPGFLFLMWTVFKILVGFVTI